MSAKSCLLCGKALSRIWVGSGEDFCSREHRNQYRLRRGMDRLLEANKLASLMRKRENLKPIPGPGPTAESDLARHAFEATQYPPHKLETLKLRHDQTTMGAHFEPAGIKELPAVRAMGHARNLEVSPHSVSKVIPTRSRESAAPPAKLSAQADMQPLPHSPRRGLDLRVSLSSGFRLRPPVSRELKVPVPAAADMKTTSTVITKIVPTDLKQRLSRAQESRPFPQRAPLKPETPNSVPPTQIRWPGPHELVARQPGVLGSPLKTEAPWKRSKQSVIGPRREQVRPGGMPGTRPLRVFAVPVPAIDGPASARNTVVPFKPADAPFGYGSEEFERS